MVGLTDYSCYIPRGRLARSTIAAAWGAAPRPGWKAVRGFDEDSLTLGQAAAWPLIQRNGPAGALYFASTSSPYWQRSAASLIAAACDLPPDVATADLGGSLRSAATALRAAFDAVAAGARRHALVVAAESRDPAPESEQEMAFGDAAAAVAVGAEEVIAELAGWAARSDDFLDEWRREADPHVHSLASKFSLRGGYQANVVAVGRKLLEQAALEPAGIAIAALASPDGEAHRAAARALGIPPERLQDPRMNDAGVTGAAMPLLLLAQALDRARAGDWILAIGYGDGAEGFLLRATDRLERMERPRLAPEALAIEVPTYPLYRKLRESLRQRGGGTELSNVLWQREEAENIRLRGTLCPRCGRVQFPRTRVCAGCRNSQGLAEKPLGRRGRVFTFTRDFLYDAPASPNIMAVVDLEGGGRFLCQMTDADPERVEIGMEVELVLRRLRESASMHHYYWKCRPRS